MKNLLTILALSLLTLSCSTSKPESNALLPPVVLNNNDSVKVETIIKTIYVPVEVDVDLPQQSEMKTVYGDSSHVETDLAESDAWINEDGSLGHSIRNKGGQLHGNAYVPQTSESTNKEAVKVREVPVPDPYPVYVERKLSLMEQIKLAAFWYLVGAVIISIAFIFRKSLLTVFRKLIRY